VQTRRGIACPAALHGEAAQRRTWLVGKRCRPRESRARERQAGGEPPGPSGITQLLRDGSTSMTQPPSFALNCHTPVGPGVLETEVMMALALRAA